MFTFEIRINGSLVGHIYGRNKGAVGNGEHCYDYEHYEPEKRVVRPGTVRHAQKDGINKLVARILADISGDEAAAAPLSAAPLSMSRLKKTGRKKA